MLAFRRERTLEFRWRFELLEGGIEPGRLLFVLNNPFIRKAHNLETSKGQLRLKSYPYLTEWALNSMLH